MHFEGNMITYTSMSVIMSSSYSLLTLSVPRFIQKNKIKNTHTVHMTLKCDDPSVNKLNIEYLPLKAL